MTASGCQQPKPVGAGYAPVVQYEPTPYDLDLTGDPEATWDEIQADRGPEAEAL